VAGGGGSKLRGLEQKAREGGEKVRKNPEGPNQVQKTPVPPTQRTAALPQEKTRKKEENTSGNLEEKKVEEHSEGLLILLNRIKELKSRINGK